MTDMRPTWTENKFQNLTFECHVDNKESDLHRNCTIGVIEM
jgi:hypothetical protein